MGELQPLFIFLIAMAFFGGSLLGWLLRGERRQRGDNVRLQRLQTQLEASQALADKLQRQRDELQKKADDAAYRHHQHQRQVRAYREGLDELALRNRRLDKRIAIAREKLRASDEEKDKLQRQLKLMIKRTSASRNAAPQDAPPSRPRIDPDDLKQVRGIGPALEKKLHALGITNLQALANLSATRIDALDRELAFPGRIHRDRWVEQAQQLLSAGAGN